MKLVIVALVTALLVAAHLPMGFTSLSTAPAFLWSPHRNGYRGGVIGPVDYRTLFPSDLAKSVMSEGGWSNILCSGEETPPESLDFAVLFVGNELHSRDISRPRKADPKLVDSLKVFIENSNFSLAFPYVAASKENKALESSLIAEFQDTCGNSLEIRNIAVLDSCSVENEKLEKLADISAVQDYLVLKMEKKSRVQANLILVCHGGSDSRSVPDLSLSEAEILSQLISSFEQLDAKYTVLYVSDSFGSNQHSSHRELERFLAEGAFGNGSVNSTCDGVCQIKSSLLEGIFVGIVLLIILISGLCCMAGIDTPTRFETPQDS